MCRLGCGHSRHYVGIYGTDAHASCNIVITPLGGMLLVYRPETRGHVAPEGGGSATYWTRGVIISLWLGGCIKRCEEWL